MTVHGALTAELPIALDQHPNLITIWLAVNDLDDNVTATDYRTDLDTLLQHLRTALPDTKIVIGNVPDLTTLPAFSGADKTALTQQVNAYNSVISSEAQKYHTLLVDLHAQPLERSYISRDGFHPNAQGYQVLAKIFYQIINANT
jgi:lysophospholipase L1-like esterase